MTCTAQEPRHRQSAPAAVTVVLNLRQLYAEWLDGSLVETAIQIRRDAADPEGRGQTVDVNAVNKKGRERGRVIFPVMPLLCLHVNTSYALLSPLLRERTLYIIRDTL